jgi:hypothetical protein
MDEMNCFCWETRLGRLWLGGKGGRGNCVRQCGVGKCW